MMTIERISNAPYGRSRIAGVSGMNPELPDPMKPPETPAIPTIPDNDAEIALIHTNSLRGKLADIQGAIRQNSTYNSVFQNYRQLLGLLMEKREQMHEKLKELAQLKNKEENKKAQQEALWKKIDTFKQQINDIVNRTHFYGNKLFSAEGQDTEISVGNDVVIEIPAKDFGVGPTDLDSSEEQSTLAKKIKKEIQKLMDYDGFLLEVEKKIGSVTTLMEFKLHDVLNVEKSMAEKNMTMELAKFSLARVLQDMRKALRGQSNVSPAAAAVLLINEN